MCLRYSRINKSKPGTGQGGDGAIPRRKEGRSKDSNAREHGVSVHSCTRMHTCMHTHVSVYVCGTMGLLSKRHSLHSFSISSA